MLKEKNTLAKLTNWVQKSSSLESKLRKILKLLKVKGTLYTNFQNLHRKICFVGVLLGNQIVLKHPLDLFRLSEKFEKKCYPDLHILIMFVEPRSWSWYLKISHKTLHKTLYEKLSRPNYKIKTSIRYFVRDKWKH